MCPGMTSLRSRLHTWALAILLTAAGLSVLIWGLRVSSWFYDCIGAIVLVAAAGAITSHRWAALLIYTFAALFALDWLWAFGVEYRSGFLSQYLRGLPPLQGVLSFLPALAMFSLIGYCCYIAGRYVGKGARHI
jgi:hypothetical protein